MRVGYTEFSFGYAFTENLIRSSPTAPTGAPVFPNLIQEGVSGFDIQINFPSAPLFLQYKLPELMRRGTAFEIAKWQCSGLTVPFFRIAMMRRDISRQHELLIRLESLYPSNVFYVASCLKSIRAFDLAYNQAAVARNSVFFSPTDIGPLPDDKTHTIAYRSDLPVGYFCSEPKAIKKLTFEELSNSLSRQFHEDRSVDVSSIAREMRQTVLAFASPTMRQTEQVVAERVKTRLRISRADAQPEKFQAITDILVAREVARVDMGIDVVIAQKPFLVTD